MNKRLKKKNVQKLCMYFCMNAYLVSFIDIDFSGFDVPPLISEYVKTIPMFSVLSKRNIERQFHKGLEIFHRHSRKRRIIWEYTLPLLKSKKLTEHLCGLVVEMYRLRLHVLREHIEELLTDEDCGYIDDMCHGLKLSGNDTDKLIQKIKLILLKQETEA